MPGFEVGGSWRFGRSEIEKWIKRQEAGKSQEAGKRQKAGKS